MATVTAPTSNSINALSQSVSVFVPAGSVAFINISGTFSGTLSFSLNQGSGASSVNLTNLGTGASQSSTTATGSWKLATTAGNDGTLIIQASAWTSGTAIVDAYLEEMVNAGGFTVGSAQSKTRPANTTAYAIGQVVSESTSAGTSWSFANVARIGGGSGVISGVVLTDSSAQSTTPQFNLWLFSAQLNASMNDAAAFAPTAADLTNLVAIVPLNNWTGASSNGALQATEINRPFVCAAGTTTLYGVLVAANAYTPTSGEKFGITLWVGQD